MECKYCKAELEEGSSVCPVCGKDNKTPDEQGNVTEEMEAEFSQPEESAVEKNGEKTSVGKLIVAIVAGAALLAVLVCVIVMGLNGGFTSGDETTGAAEDLQASTGETVEATIPADGNPDDVTCKGTYTVSDDEAKAANAAVVATMGDSELTNGLLQIYYWNLFYNSYTSYISSYGLDLSVPLDAQLSPDGITWQQTMLNIAIDNWRVDAALAKLAEKSGLKLSAEKQAELDSLGADLEAQAVENGYESFEAMIQESLGAGCTLEDYLEYARLYYNASAYYNQEVEKITVSDAEMEDFYTEDESSFTEQGIDKTTRWVDVRHILIQPEGCTFDDNNYVVADDDQWEACRAEAQAVLDNWLANDGTEEGFAGLAKELTADGNGEQGGLYEKVSEGQMVATFNDWCFDEARQPGDSGLVKTEFGYHIMYFVESEFVWEYYAEQNVLTLKKNEIYNTAVEAEEMTVEYSKVVLGAVNYLGE